MKDEDISCPICKKGIFQVEKSAQDQPLNPHIFISHAWDYTDKYHSAVKMLDSAYKHEWRNRSISKVDAYKIQEGPELRIKQQREEVKTRIFELNERIEKEERSLCEFEQRTALLRDRERHLKDVFSDEAIKIRYELDEYEKNHHMLSQPLALLEFERKKLISHFENERVALEIFKTKSPFAMTTKREMAIREHPLLALVIHKAVSSSDLVIVIASPESAFKYWIEYEIELAIYSHKPLLGLGADPNREELPPEYRNCGIVQVPWDERSLRTEIDCHVKSIRTLEK